MDIKFSWNGKKYHVNEAAIEKKYIVLPNRRVIEPLQWLLSGKQDEPYKLLSSATEVTHPLEHASLGEIANHFGNAIIASEDD